MQIITVVVHPKGLSLFFIALLILLLVNNIHICSILYRFYRFHLHLRLHLAEASA